MNQEIKLAKNGTELCEHPSVQPANIIMQYAVSKPIKISPLPSYHRNVFSMSVSAKRILRQISDFRPFCLEAAVAGMGNYSNTPEIFTHNSPLPADVLQNPA